MNLVWSIRFDFGALAPSSNRTFGQSSQTLKDVSGPPPGLLPSIREHTPFDMVLQNLATMAQTECLDGCLRHVSSSPFPLDNHIVQASGNNSGTNTTHQDLIDLFASPEPPPGHKTTNETHWAVDPSPYSLSQLTPTKLHQNMSSDHEDPNLISPRGVEYSPRYLDSYSSPCVASKNNSLHVEEEPYVPPSARLTAIHTMLDKHATSPETRMETAISKMLGIQTTALEEKLGLIVQNQARQQEQLDLLIQTVARIRGLSNQVECLNQTHAEQTPRLENMELPGLDEPLFEKSLEHSVSRSDLLSVVRKDSENSPLQSCIDPKAIEEKHRFVSDSLPDIEDRVTAGSSAKVTTEIEPDERGAAAANNETQSRRLAMAPPARLNSPCNTFTPRSLHASSTRSYTISSRAGSIFSAVSRSQRMSTRSSIGAAKERSQQGAGGDTHISHKASKITAKPSQTAETTHSAKRRRTLAPKLKLNGRRLAESDGKARGQGIWPKKGTNTAVGTLVGPV
ncbi:hypothetical protein BD324DRAFT_238502 [Kockovaella imperatae]|uniref:Uncharacterized protein n=1 Tax=Kockovaella imperatae TaxID=4999 RepID=A0A1Y1UP79_9TREE|nr:hypothetical protein BD324DRAFT_238502 [Kockovaella imperatae]ORX39838.1 hypothetical protein BD324DRAFT_238502 [Kockovaella imperatae]